MEIKKCNDCLTEKSVEEFYIKRIGKRGQNLYTSRCKVCQLDRNMKNYYNESPEKRKRRRDLCSASHLLRKFGLTTEEFSAMIEQQNNKCKICECDMSSPQVDHNHTTGKVRALLCRSCNTSLGLLKEDSKILYNMISYINDHL
jgi:hypothetical protein